MRNLVQPPPSLYCELCGGELRLKLIEPEDPALGLEVERFFCAKCGREYSYSVARDRYAAQSGRNIQPR
jgi:hypothetical protein